MPISLSSWLQAWHTRKKLLWSVRMSTFILMCCFNVFCLTYWIHVICFIVGDIQGLHMPPNQSFLPNGLFRCSMIQYFSSLLEMFILEHANMRRLFESLSTRRDLQRCRSPILSPQIVWFNFYTQNNPKHSPLIEQSGIAAKGTSWPWLSRISMNSSDKFNRLHWPEYFSWFNRI